MIIPITIIFLIACFATLIVMGACAAASGSILSAWRNKTHIRQAHGPKLAMPFQRAGEAGRIFEAFTSSDTAARLIYLKSTGMVPDFYANDEIALADIKKCAEQAMKLKQVEAS